VLVLCFVTAVALDLRTGVFALTTRKRLDVEQFMIVVKSPGDFWLGFVLLPKNDATDGRDEASCAS
jgi:hypothetical protein